MHRIHPTRVIAFFEGLSNSALYMENTLYRGFKTIKNKQNHLIFLNIYVNSRENVIGGCAVTWDECILFVNTDFGSQHYALERGYNMDLFIMRKKRAIDQTLQFNGNWPNE